MKLKKRVISLLLVTIMMFNSIPAIHASAGELTINGSLTDAITDMEYGWDGSTYRFAEDVLGGVQDGDEVYLVADVVTSDPLTAGSTVSLKLINFRLEGANAADYLLPELTDILPVQKEIKILAKTIAICPAQTYIYYGQDTPAGGILTELADYSSQLVGDDEVRISCAFKVQFNGSSEIGTYDINLQGIVTAEGEDASNYQIEAAENLKFDIRAYMTDAEAVPEEGFDGNYDGKLTTKLYAPEGFRISTTGGMNNSEWKSSITVTLEETQSGSITYYLRNNNSEDAAYYRAICEKTHNYSSIPTPTVTGIKIELVDPDKKILFREDGVFANNDIKVTAYVSGSTIAQDTMIFLSKNGELASILVPAENAEEKDGRYTYQASFDIKSTDGESAWYYLDAYAENSAGTGERYSVSNSTDTFVDTDTKVTAPLVIDRKPAEVDISSINGNYHHAWIRAECFIEDPDSGVAKVEYKWDQAEYAELTDYDSSETKFCLDLSWDEAQRVEGGRHTLSLRVTDAMGNVTEPSRTDDKGSDFMDPVVESVEIKTESGKEVVPCSDGYFSNEPVQIIIKAHDNEADPYTVSSGVKSVKVNEDANGFEAVWNEEANAYVLTVAPDRKLTNVLITVTDGCGLDTPEYLKDLIQGVEIGNIYVEDKAPSISFENFDELKQVYDNMAWIDINKIDEKLEIVFQDNPYKPDNSEQNCSGLAQVIIKDGENVLYQRDYSVGDVEGSFAYDLSKFAEGDHTITVTVVDNCGNSTPGSISFTKKTTITEAAKISIENPEGKKIGEDCWFAGENDITFRVGTTDNATKLAKIELNINGEKPEYDYKKIIEDDDIYGVSIDTSDFELSEDHTYTISATIYDLAMNHRDLDPVTVYVDTEAPKIHRITVQKSGEPLADQVLRLLPFGIYSNDKLTFRVYASDADYDSGLDYGTVQFSAEGAPVRMEWDDQNGCYWFELSASEDAISESTLAFAVYDRFGRSCEACVPIQNTNDENDQTDSTAVMIEKEVPMMSFALPKGDGCARTDGQKWYNDSKALELNVQDVESGIHSISFKVNGVPVTEDNKGNALISKPTAQENDNITYFFDTDGLAEIAGESENGEYHIEIVMTDNAGNKVSFAESYYIDKEPPKIDSIRFIPVTVDGITDTVEFVENLEYGFFFNEDLTVVVNMSDEKPSSGLYALKYRLVVNEEGVNQTVLTDTKAIEDGKVVIAAPEGFMGQIFVEALDYTNNSSGEKTTKAYVTDSTAPDISITKNVQTTYRDAEGNALYTKTNAFTVVITDYIAGLRQISYTKTAERFPQGQQTITISNRVYQPGDILDDGWEVVSVNHNLVTQIRKTFEFAADDNNVAMHFNAMDCSHNRTDTVSSEVFTIDTIAPVIRIEFHDDPDDDLYYDQNRVADIFVTERNFDAARINVLIQNAFGAVPGYSFSAVSLTEHTATIDFGEGDYSFDVNGSDLSGRDAVVTFSGGNEKLFYVDKTVPVIVENFAEFANDKENSFNIDKTAMITITEHNFDPGLTNLRITRKAAGEEHSQNGMVDVTAEILAGNSWTKNGDSHSMEFTFSKDAVYFVQIAPVDLASNHGNERNSVVFEIDKTVPVVSAKNENQTGEDDIQLLDIYSYERKDNPVPTVEFMDQNISHIEYTLMTYIPEYLNDGLVRIKPVTTQGIVEGNLFTLENFASDGIYAVELVAVDVAGNRSTPNTNTYARLVYQDVLAFILDSNSTEGTGLYSLEHENGEAISKKPYDFKDLRVLVMAPAETDIDIVLRDTNGNDIQTESNFTTDNSVYGINVSTFEIDEAFFRENFQDDIDMEMNLTVRNQEYRIDLAKIHIDSIAPTCDIPEELTAWRWFAGEADRVFTLTNISELLEEADCKVYDNGELVPFDYFAEEDTITFKLSKGWHNIGIILCDAAGNSNINPEIVNIYIGNFWIIMAGTVFAAVVIAVVIALAYKRKREKKEMTEDI